MSTVSSQDIPRTLLEERHCPQTQVSGFRISSSFSLHSELFHGQAVPQFSLRLAITMGVSEENLLPCHLHFITRWTGDVQSIAAQILTLVEPKTTKEEGEVTARLCYG